MRIEINTHNAAFQDGNCDAEVHRIIQKALMDHSGSLQQTEDGDKPQRYPLRDLNGNTCGFIEY